MLVQLWFAGMVFMGVAGAVIVVRALWRSRSRR